VRRDFRLWFGLAVTGALVVAAVGAPWLAPHDPLAQDLLSAQLPPFWSPGADPQYPLGTDSLGRDLLSRLIYGGRIAFVNPRQTQVFGERCYPSLRELPGRFGRDRRQQEA